MFAAVYAATPVMAASLIAVAVAASMFTLSPSWAACMDIGGENTAVLSAAMNTTGQIGSILSPVITGWIVYRFADWQMPLLIMGGLYCAIRHPVDAGGPPQAPRRPDASGCRMIKYRPERI